MKTIKSGIKNFYNQEHSLNELLEVERKRAKNQETPDSTQKITSFQPNKQK